MREYEELLKLVSQTGLRRLAERHPTFSEMIMAEFQRRSKGEDALYPNEGKAA